MANYVAIPAGVIETFLQSKGFIRKINTWQGCQEVVYERAHEKNSDVKIKVFTSIRIGQAQVRAVGKDSIKVAVVFDNSRKSFGVGKFPPIFRVHSIQSVLDRMLERMRDAYKRGSEWIAQNERQQTQYPSNRGYGYTPKPRGGILPPPPVKTEMQVDLVHELAQQTEISFGEAAVQLGYSELEDDGSFDNYCSEPPPPNEP